MQYRKKLITAAVLMVCCIVIHIYSIDPLRVEAGYSTKFFPGMARILRSISGFLPFSVGDILYGAAFVFLCSRLFFFLRFIFIKKRRENAGSKIKGTALSFVTICSIIYIVFNIFWGINYNRVGIAAQLGLKIEKYSAEDLKMINGILVQKVNASKFSLITNHITYPSRKKLFSMTVDAYKNIAATYPFLKYEPASLKSSMWGWIGNYTGFLGYYNPFTGEGQVNTSVPAFTQPFTACHETAHQVGYAKEMEANFVGYLAAVASSETLFHYSVYTDLFSYANRSLYLADSASALQYRKMLLPEVIADFKERRKFNDAHTSFLHPIIMAIYGKFLQSNQQPMGILSYDEVTAFIIAYYKKFGRV